MTAASVASSTEAGVLVANHHQVPPSGGSATARPLLKEVRTITDGGTQAPPLLYPQEKRVPASYPTANYPCTRSAPGGEYKLISKTVESKIFSNTILKVSRLCLFFSIEQMIARLSLVTFKISDLILGILSVLFGEHPLGV
ncbi:hypothetical protein AVEN_262465-1 [Araneus ventricosus]|uniref:Uncharacterized protein n=1 Tax=Araneus ventricosus TaxID=182803 RepID=A0A4Y2G724_ARAVE|nr:hypothetical protein AVEN_262465-1 [Araneus ventricosus]